jgi:cell wall-associated NlpC family hydrolase
VALAMIVTLAAPALAPTSPAAAAPADDLAAKRAQAAQLEEQIAANGDRISMLDEDYNETRIAIDDAARGIAEAQANLDALSAQTEDLRHRLARRAAVLYTSGGTDTLDLLDAGNINDVASRSRYGAAAAEQDERLVDDLTLAREQLEDMRAQFDRTRAEAEAKQAALAATRDELEAAQDDQEVLLGRVNGDIAELIAEIEAQRQREEAERARRELERRKAEERAKAAQRVSTPRSSGGSSGAAVPNVGAPNANAQVAVDTAKAQIGKPYRYAGAGPDSFDCSGLTQFAWAAAGVSLPHSSRAQYASLPHVAMEELAPGDLVFYGSPIHHVGVYVGNGAYVHAPQTGDTVKVASIYRGDYAGGARPG